MVLNNAENDSMKKLKYLKYSNMQIPKMTPNVVNKDDFFRFAVLLIAIPRK
jgi:hypothetical protein